MRKTLAAVARRGRTIKQPLQRYKGLGEMDADQLAVTTMEPAVRTLRRVTAEDAHSAGLTRLHHDVSSSSTGPPGWTASGSTPDAGQPGWTARGSTPDAGHRAPKVSCPVSARRGVIASGTGGMD